MEGVHKGSALREELQAAKECWEQEKESSSVKSTPIGYPAPNG